MRCRPATAFSMLLLLATAAWWAGPIRAQPAPPALTLSVAASTVGVGRTARLSWVLSGATRCTLSGAWSGTLEGTAARSGSRSSGPLPFGENQFTLGCEGVGGSISRTVTVKAVAAPVVTLTAAAPTIELGKAVALRWSATDAVACKASGAWSGDQATQGAAESVPAAKGAKTFTLACTGPGGSGRSSVKVSILPKPQLTFSALASEVATGKGTTLRWRATDVTSCTASGAWSGEQKPSGSQSTGTLTNPSNDYTLRCVNDIGEVSQSLSVSVLPPPVLTFNLSDAVVNPEGAVTLNWTASNARSCRASRNWSGEKTSQGSETIGALSRGTKTYTLTCTGAGGTTAVTRSLAVAAAPKLTFTATPATVSLGSGTRLSWSTVDATDCVASGSWDGSRGKSGSFTTEPFLQTGDRSFTLACTGPAGSVSASTTVKVQGAVPTLVFTALPTQIALGSSTQLRWTVGGAVSCTASGEWQGAKSATSGVNTATVTPTVSGFRTYTLSCSNSEGSVSRSATVEVLAPALSLSPSAIDFGTTAGGSMSTIRDIVLTSSGKVALSIGEITFSGTHAAQFTQTNNCPATLESSKTCTIAVRFVPIGSGERSAQLRIATNAPGGVRTVALKATAPVASLSFNLLTPSFIQTDSDTNDPNGGLEDNGSDAPQSLNWPFAVGGYVNEPLTGSAGQLQREGDLEDYYRVSLLAGQKVVLELAGDGVFDDVDLYLYTPSGTLVDASESENNLEVVTAPTNAEYIVVVSVFSGSSRYLLVSDSATNASRFGSSTLALDLVPNQALVVLKPEAREALRGGGRPAGDSPLRQVDELADPVTDFKILSGSIDSVVTVAVASPKRQTLPWGQFASEDQRQRWLTQRAIRELRTDSRIQSADPDFIMRTLAEPNDPQYPKQKWHYDLIQLPAAWDISTGNPDVVVAVIDSGVARHPDLVENLLGGYDFVSSDPSGDGDGRDNDPSDPGIIRSGSSIRTSHGTHVAGTVAARGNNAQGVTGVGWTTKILPVRALNATGSGSSSDIIEGMRYAAGLTTLQPPRKADIINLSLGSDSSNCSSSYQQVINEVRAAGVMVVAAAGNSSLSFVGSPANCNGVIAVSALGSLKQISSYSNRGTALDVAAPGGDAGIGVFSTDIAREGDGPVNFTYRGSLGTSMATPHVAGVLAMMKGVKADLTPVLVDTYIAAGALTDDIGETGKDLLYGYGAINTVRALTTAKTGVIPSAPFKISFSPGTLDFGDTSSLATVTLTLTGDIAGLTGIKVSASRDWISSPGSATAIDARNYRIAFAVDRSKLPIGTSEAVLTFTATFNGLSVPSTLKVIVARKPDTYVGSGGAQYALLYDPVNESVVAEANVVANGPSATAQINDVEPGQYWLVVGADVDNDLFICDLGEACAAYPVTSALWETLDVRGAKSGVLVESIYLTRLSQQGRLDLTSIGAGKFSRGFPRRNGLMPTGAVPVSAAEGAVEVRFVGVDASSAATTSTATSVTTLTVAGGSSTATPIPQSLTLTGSAQTGSSSGGLATPAVSLALDPASPRRHAIVVERSVGVQRWWLEYRDSDGGVLAKQSLPDTVPVTWRTSEASGLELPTSGWVARCAGRVWTVQDGYQLTVGRFDEALLEGSASEVELTDLAEASVVQSVGCDGEAMRIQGVVFQVDAEQPQRSAEAVPGMRFEVTLDAEARIVRKTLDTEAVSVGSLCDANSRSELDAFCKAWRSGP